MDGIIFYWFAWIGWVIFTFLQKKSTQRFVVCLSILLLLIGSVHQISILELEIGISYIMILFICYIVVSKKRKSLIAYTFIVCMIEALAYVSFHLFELFDPVWLVFNRQWMLSFMMVYLTLMLVKDYQARVVTVCIGLAQGELLYSLVLQDLNFSVEMGSFRFLDSLAITVMLISTWNFIESFTKTLEVVVRRKFGRKAGINQ